MNLNSSPEAWKARHIIIIAKSNLQNNNNKKKLWELWINFRWETVQATIYWNKFLTFWQHFHCKGFCKGSKKNAESAFFGLPRLHLKMAKKVREVSLYGALVFGQDFNLTQHKCLWNLLILSFCFTIGDAPEIHLDCSSDNYLVVNT